MYKLSMICEKKFSNILTTIDSIKNKITNQEYMKLMNQLKAVFDVLDKELVCEECGDVVVAEESSDDSDSDNDTI